MRRIAYDFEFIETVQPKPDLVGATRRLAQAFAGEPVPPIPALPTLDPISIGLVDVDTGREYYGINQEFDPDAFLAIPWLIDNVLPHLPYTIEHARRRRLVPDPTHHHHDRLRTRAQLALEVTQFLAAGDPTDADLELWADYAASDHVSLCWLIGPRYVDLPTWLPQHTNDVQTYARIARLDTTTNPLPTNVASTAHLAIADARECANRVRFIDRHFRSLVAANPT